MLKISRFIFQEKGLGLVEIIIVIFIMMILSGILIFNFPLVQRNFALSRASYKVAEVFRKAQDLGLSGVVITSKYGDRVPAKGYGVYFNCDNNSTEYFIYADIDGDQAFSFLNNENYFCNNYNKDDEREDDCIIENFDLTKENQDLYISGCNNINSFYTSINFEPPNPNVNISNKGEGSEIGIIISLKSDDDQEQSRIIWVNTKGLVKVE